MKPTLWCSVVLLAVAPASLEARPLDLPVRYPGAAAVAAPAYRGDLIEVRLSAAAAPVALPLARNGAARADRLGVPALDRLAADFGGAWFEPEFRGEEPPPAGTDEPDFTAFWLMHLPVGVVLEEALARVAALPEVAGADPVAVLPVTATPNDSLWAISYWFYQASRRDIHAPEAWDVTTGDTAIVVAILDTGVLPYHPDLGGAAAGLWGQLWVNRAERAGLPGVDDDQNGFVDDVWGWDFVNTTTVAGTLDGEDYLVTDNDPNDYAGHGTAVAGLVGAITDNRIGVASTARQVRLMAVRVGYATQASPLGEVDMSFVAQAFRYATRMGANVINCSFASLNQAGLDLAVSAAVHAGVTVVVAAGNGGSPNFLGSREDVVAVAATNDLDQVATFSNRGSYVDLSAPGVEIASTFIARPGADSIGVRQPTYVTGLNGTSFSAPMVSGAAALLQAMQRASGRRPLDPMGALLRLRETSDDISAQNPTLTGYGTGRLDLLRALTDPPTSQAWRGQARTVGSAVIVPRRSGRPLVAYLTSDRKLLVLDGDTGDTLTLATLPGTVLRQLAAADLGGGHGVGLFTGVGGAQVAGLDLNGIPLAGWPVSLAGTLVQAVAGPALGDLDGDGALEVVCGGSDGKLWAWRADGTVVTGFPVSLNGSLNAPPALGDLDGNPGVEIVVAAGDGSVHAVRGDGSELPGWPVAGIASPFGPLIARLGLAGPTAVVIAAGTSLRAYAANGAARFNVPLGGTAFQDPAAGDLDGDGADEFVVALSSPNAVAVFDSAGMPLTARNWPRRVSGTPQGPPVIGHLAAGGAPGVMLMRGGTLLALGSMADSLPAFPKPGGAGTQPTLAETDADGATEIAAGTGPDSVIYLYDAGAGTWASGPQPWPTARANFARTASRLYSPGLVALDDVPPQPVTDLAPGRITTGAIELTWTAPADDGPSGRAAQYELRYATFPFDPGNFASGLLAAGMPVPGPAGAPESVTVASLRENTAYYFALRSRDAAGNQSPLSNQVQAMTQLSAPARVADLRGVAVTDSSVTLRWTASGEDGTSGRPDHYVVRAAPGPLDSASFLSAPLERLVPATVDAGGEETLVFAPLERGRLYGFGLVAVDHAGNQSPLSNLITARTGVGGPLAGKVGVLLACAARPARPPVGLYWQGAAEAYGTHQYIRIFDLTGRRLRTLVAGNEGGGVVSWDGRDEGGARLPAGHYFARLESGPFHAQTRIVLLW